jgi:hypothetical protein
MVTNHHEVGHTLFGDDPNLISRALRHAGLDFPDLVNVEQLGTDLSTVEPVERRADRVIRFETAAGQEGILVLEVQRERDNDKPAAWGFYGMTLVNRYKLPVVIVVITTASGCERWAGQTFDFGLGMGDALAVRPLVLGPDSVRAITHVSDAEADPFYAALSVVVHRDDRNVDAILKAVADGLATTPDPDRAVLVDYIELTLGKSPAAELWRKLMSVHPDVFQGPTIRGMIDKAVAEGKARGEAEGRARGEAEGMARGEAEFLLKAIELRQIELTAEQTERVSTCTDQEQLEQWLERLFTATDAEGIFGG